MSLPLPSLPVPHKDVFELTGIESVVVSHGFFVGQ